ncbi:MAG: hypothetical protein ABIY55_24230, partial [Kofleriaceae bacterium]
MSRDRRLGDGTPLADSATSEALGPGKQTLTASLPLLGGAGPSAGASTFTGSEDDATQSFASVQRKETGDASRDSGGGGQLPQLERIHGCFGVQDVAVGTAHHRPAPRSQGASTVPLLDQGSPDVKREAVVQRASAPANADAISVGSTPAWDVVATPRVVRFPETELGAVSAPCTITLCNRGSTPIDVTSLELVL